MNVVSSSVNASAAYMLLIGQVVVPRYTGLLEMCRDALLRKFGNLAKKYLTFARGTAIMLSVNDHTS